jgi:hypothetical protein
MGPLWDRRIAVGLALGAALAGCLPPVAYPERSGPWPGTRKQTIKVAQEALKEAMAGVKLVPAPGNDAPVSVAEASEGSEACVNTASFTLPGKREDMLGDAFQYAWHLCLNDDQTYALQIACLQVKRSETSTDLVECKSGKIAGLVARRSDDVIGRLRSGK